MPRASVNGIEIDYELRGSGPAVVLVHGFACGQRMWFQQARVLGRRYQVVTYDMRGHGGSSAPESVADYNDGAFVGDLAGLLDHLGIERCVLVGFSMGGGPALGLALRQPQRVAGLVLADVGAGSDNPAALRRQAEVWLTTIAHRGREALIESILTWPLIRNYARKRKLFGCHMRLLMEQHSLAGYRGLIAGILARRRSLFQRQTQLARLRVPTLVIAGHEDFDCRKSSALLARAIPGARLVLVPGAGHMLPLEQPRAFTAALAEFLDSLGIAGGRAKSRSTRPM